MAHASYVFLRRDTGTYYFRWIIPAAVRSILGCKREVKRSLDTEQRRVALRLARRLSVMLEQATSQLMAARISSTESPAVHLTAKLFERLVDGTVRIEGLELDPAHGEEDRKHLAALLGATAANAAVSPDTRKVSDLIAAYFDEGHRAKRWTEKTRQELDAIYALMAEVIGADKPLSELSRKDFAYFKDALAKLPSNRSKDPRYRDKSVLELIGMKVPAADLMSISTINKVLIRVSSLMKWGVVHGYVASNYAEGMTLAKSKRDDEEREPWADEEVRTMLSAVLSGQHGSEGAPYRKWVPLIGAYSGMRLNEICQLAIADFGEVEGIPVITITDEGDDGKRVKTANSRRAIPVHPELVSLGLLAYVEAQRKAGIARLFPELSKGRDGYGATVSKWFARFRQRLGVKREFHALRHTVANHLRDAGVVEDVVADVLGHSRSQRETFGRYAKAASLRRLYDALCKLTYETKQPIALRLVSGGIAERRS
jgi:integrase